MNTYTISEFANMLNITVHSLRYWEKELALKINRDKLGYRYYNDEDLKLFQRILSLKEQGFKIKAIKNNLESNVGNNESNHLVSPIHKSEALGIDLNNSKISEYDSDKIKQFAGFLKIIVNESIKENQEVLRTKIRKDMANEIEKSRQYSEALEEKNFKKLDMTLREMQKARQEAATTNEKKKIFKFFKKQK